MRQFGLSFPRWLCSADGAGSGGGETPPKPATPLTQADIDSAVAKALETYKAGAAAETKRLTDEAEVKKLEAEGKWKEIVERITQEREAAKTAAADSEKARKSAERKATVEKVAAEKKLTPAVAAKLRGETEAEIKADADRRIAEAIELAKAQGVVTGTPPSPHRHNSGGAGGNGDLSQKAKDSQSRAMRSAY